MTTDIKAGLYQHYKGGHYLVLFTATHTESEDSLVVYATPPGDTKGEPKYWVRPTKMFIESVQVGDREVKRFDYVRPLNRKEMKMVAPTNG